MEIEIAQAGVNTGADVALDRLHRAGAAGIGDALGLCVDGRDALAIVHHGDGEAVVGVFQRTEHRAIALLQANAAAVSAGAVVWIAWVVGECHGVYPNKKARSAGFSVELLEH